MNNKTIESGNIKTHMIDSAKYTKDGNGSPNRAFYKSAKIHYDSTLFYMPDDFRGREQAKARQEVLEGLVLHLDIINMQDSLQALAKLPKVELEEIINQIIQEEVEKERAAISEKDQVTILENDGALHIGCTCDYAVEHRSEKLCVRTECN